MTSIFLIWHWQFLWVGCSWCVSILLLPIKLVTTHALPSFLFPVRYMYLLFFVRYCETQEYIELWFQYVDIVCITPMQLQWILSIFWTRLSMHFIAIVTLFYSFSNSFVRSTCFCCNHRHILYAYGCNIHTKLCSSNHLSSISGLIPSTRAFLWGIVY